MMKHYLKIFRQMGIISLMNLTEYRGDFFVTGFFKLIETATSFGMTFILLSQIHNLAGWDKYQVLLISLTYSLTMAITAFFLLPGLEQFSEDLNHGSIDTYLVKPINLQFFASVSRWDWSQSMRIIGALTAVLYIAGNFLPFNTPINYLYYFAGLFISVCTLYIFGCILITLILYFKRILNIDYFLNLIWDFGSYPVSIYSPVLRIAFSTAVPLAFAATVPVGVFSGKYSVLYLFGGAVLVIILEAVELFLLKFGIRRYSGAGN